MISAIKVPLFRCLGAEDCAKLRAVLDRARQTFITPDTDRFRLTEAIEAALPH